MKHVLSTLTLSIALLGCNLALAEESTPAPKKDHTPVYSIYADIVMHATVKYDYGKKMIMKYVFPQLTSDTADEYLDRFNNAILTINTEITDEFTKKISDNLSAQKQLPPALAKANNNLQVDYDSSSIESGSDNYLVSVRFSVFGNIVGMAHPYHYHRVFNYNLDTGETVELAQLFKPDADYLAVLSNYTRGELERRLEDKAMVADGTEAKADNFKVWNIKPNGILITFDEAQVAPAVFGAQTVLVPYSVLKPLIADDAVIAGCVNHHRSCASSNVLTGGFIDEAALSTQKTYALKQTDSEKPRTFGETAHKLLGYPLSLIHRT